MNLLIQSTLLPHLVEITLAAGMKIMEIYEGSFGSTLKLDASPVTAADIDIVIVHRAVAGDGGIPGYDERVGRASGIE